MMEKSALEIPLCRHPSATDEWEPWVPASTEWEAQERNECSCRHEPFAENRRGLSAGNLATAATAEITPRNYGILRILAFASFAFLFSTSFLVPFCIPPPRMTTSSFIPPHKFCYFACDFCSKRSPILSSPFFGIVAYSTFNDLF